MKTQINKCEKFSEFLEMSIGSLELSIMNTVKEDEKT